jgi:hypothetical protein
MDKKQLAIHMLDLHIRQLDYHESREKATCLELRAGIRDAKLLAETILVICLEQQYKNHSKQSEDTK